MGTSDGVKRRSECEVIGQTWQGCVAVERGKSCEAVAELGKGRVRLRVGVSSHLRLYLNFLAPERNNGSLQDYIKLTIYVTLRPEWSRVAQLVGSKTGLYSISVCVYCLASWRYINNFFLRFINIRLCISR